MIEGLLSYVDPTLLVLKIFKKFRKKAFGESHIYAIWKKTREMRMVGLHIALHYQ
jgi:hypothetical protein